MDVPERAETIPEPISVVRCCELLGGEADALGDEEVLEIARHMAPLFNYLAPSESADEKLVSRGGIEPPTRRLRVCCSAN